LYFNNIDITDIRIALYLYYLPSKDLPSPKTPTYSNMHSYKGIHSTAAPPTLLLIPSTPSTAFSTITTPTSTENVRVYLAIAVSAYIDIVYKWVTKIAKDV